MTSIGSIGSAPTPISSQTAAAPPPSPPKGNDGDADDAPKVAAPPSNRLLDIKA